MINNELNEEFPEEETIAVSEETEAEDIVIPEETFEQKLRILEAVLFTAQDLMTEKEMAAFFAPGTKVSELLEALQEQYNMRGVHLVKRGTGWGLRTAPDLAEKLEVRKVEVKPMSRAAIETLAIIAYHQPVTRAEIEQIRGVSISKSTFEILVAENLIKPGKRRDIPGRPLTWITTQNFLDTFGLESLKQLPNLQELRDAGLLSITPPQLSEPDPQQSLPLPGEENAESENNSEDNTSDEDGPTLEDLFASDELEQEESNNPDESDDTQPTGEAA